MPSLDQLLEASTALHNHLCPRQVLGVRMGMLAGKLLQLDLPQHNKRLLTLVETDGCFVDGVAVATGCSVGHRTLRVIDFGKVAATFVDTHTHEAVRIAPHADVRRLAQIRIPNAKSRWHAQLEAYQYIPDGEMFAVYHVTLNFSLEKLISKPGSRTACDQCGEEIINEREVIQGDTVLCRACAGQRYYVISQHDLIRR